MWETASIVMSAFILCTHTVQVHGGTKFKTGKSVLTTDINGVHAEY